MLAIIVLAALMGVMAPAAVRAQTGAPAPREQECRKAARTLKHGHPAKKEPWAKEILRMCSGPATGEAAADVVRSLRTERDTAALLDAMSPFRGLRDATFFTATLEIAQDRSATPEARAVAMRSLLGILDGGMSSVSYTSLTLEAEDCGLAIVTGFRPRDGSPLPADAAMQVRRALEAVTTSAGEPTAVRSAAACVLSAVR